MTGVTLLDLVGADMFCEIQAYLGLEQFFNLRCVSKEFQRYIDQELAKKKVLQLPSQDKRIINAFMVLCNKCCCVEKLNLSRNNWLTNELLLPMLTKNTKTLQSLSLNYCENLSSSALQPAIIECKKLKKLSLQHCLWLTDGCLETIAFHQTELVELDLSNCMTISERCLIILLNNFRRLQVLSLASVTNVTDNILFNISKYQTEIVHLNLFGCVQATDRGIGALSLNCKKLQTLSIRGCRLISERSLALLRSRNVHIDVPKVTSNTLNYQMLRQIRLINKMYLQV